MGSKITVIGAGSVGATIAYKLSSEEYVREIVMIDINKKKVAGEVMDIQQGTSFRDPVSIIDGEYEDAKDSDVVIITSGIARKPGQTRIELAQTNVDIIKDIAPKIVAVAPKAIYVMVSNPVDILTYVFLKITGLPENQVIGSGTILDTSRLRFGLSQHFDVSQQNIHAYVFGEHGDTSFVPWSRIRIAGVGMDEYYELMKDQKGLKVLDKDEMVKYVQKSGGTIIANKGATFYAIASVVCTMCENINSSADSILTVSTMMNGEYGISDVCLSLLNFIGPEGANGKVAMDLLPEEVAELRASADALKEVIASIDF